MDLWRWMVLGVTLLLVAIISTGMLVALWKQRSTMKRAWSAMSSWEKGSLQIGLLLYVGVAVLESHPTAGAKGASVMIRVVEALANALFVLGALAFLQRGHERNVTPERTRDA